MLLELIIENFRCFKRHVVPFRVSTVIVGANNAGKSTIIEALRLVAVVQKRFRALRYTRPPDWMDETSVGGMGVSPSIERFDLSPEGIFHHYARHPARIEARFQGGQRIVLYVGPEFKLWAKVYRTKTIAITSKKEANLVNFPRIAVMAPVGPIREKEVYLTDQTVRAGIGTDLSPLHFRNRLARLSDAQWMSFVKLANETWSGLQIQSIEPDDPRPSEQLSLLVRDHDFVAEIAWMGSGLQAWLQIVLFLAEEIGSPTIILDEPDVFMHPDIQRKLARLLRKFSNQDIYTTHSVELLAEVDPAEVLVVDKSAPKSGFASSLDAVQSLVDRIGTSHNLQFSRLWTARRFVLVEGSDMAILSKLHEKLFPFAATPLGSLPHESIGGWGGWQKAIGTGLALKNASGEPIRVYCILDSDYRLKAEIGARYQEASERGVNLHIWSRKEIENYLLHPGAIRRAILQQGGDLENAPGIAEVTGELESVLAELETEVFDGVAQAVSEKNPGYRGKKANQIARDYVTKAWSSLEGRLSIVPGKRAISLIAKRLNDEYAVHISAQVLARAMQPGDISEEVAGVLKAIDAAADFPQLAPA